MKRGFAVLVLCVGSAQAGERFGERFEVDEGHTRILFSVDHLGYSTQIGLFRDFDVELTFDREQPANSTLKARITAASVDMFHDELNSHLRNADFFDVEKYPDITFVSTKIEALDDSRAHVTGDLTMLGKTLPLVLDVKLNKVAPNPRTQQLTAGFAATGTLDRAAFGMGYGVPFVGKDVSFTIAMEAVRAP